MARQIGDPVHLARGELYPQLNVIQRMAPRGLPGLAMFALLGGSLLVGHWRISRALQQKAAREDEERAVRVDLAPVLQAEEDRRYLRARQRQLKAEQELQPMNPAFVPGQQSYNTRWMPPDYDKEGKW